MKLFCLLISLLAFTASAVEDAPLAMRMEDGSVLLNPPAAKKLDEELKRLQGLEREHKAEKWGNVVLISAGVGVLVGAAAIVVPMLVLRPGS